MLKVAAELEVDFDLSADDLAKLLDEHGRANPGSCSVISPGQFVDMVAVTEQLRVFDIGDKNMILVFKSKSNKAAASKQPVSKQPAMSPVFALPSETFARGTVGRGYPISTQEILTAVKMRNDGKTWAEVAKALGRNVDKLRDRVKAHLRSANDGSTKVVVHDHTKPDGKRKYRLSADEIQRIKELRASGKTLQEIVKITGRSMVTVFNNCRGLKPKIKVKK